MKTRRWLAALLVMVMVFALAVPAMAADTGLFSLSADKTSVAKGETVTVSINTTSADVIADGKLVVTYDPAHLQYQGAAAGAGWKLHSDVSLKDNASNGKLTLAFASVYAADIGSIIDLTFVTLDHGETDVALTEGYVTGAGDAVTAQKLTLVVAGCDGGEDCPSARYTDLDTTRWYHEGVDYVLNKGLFVGMSDTLFGPHISMTRAMMVQVLWRLAGAPEVEADLPFADVKADDWFYDAVAWAYTEEVTTGTSATTFAPNATLTREQLVTFLARYSAYCGQPVQGDVALLDDYADGGKVSAWARPAMAWAVQTGLVNGVTATELHPQDLAQRCQVAVILWRYDN